MAVQLKTGIVWPRTLNGWKRLLSGEWRERSVEEQMVEQQSTARLTKDEDDLPLFGAPGAHATRAALPGDAPKVITRTAKSKAKARSGWAFCTARRAQARLFCKQRLRFR